MIAYFPEIYTDETVYSWIARYNAHVGYIGYSCAAADIFETRTCHANAEFFGKLNSETAKLFGSMYGLEYLLEKHTMFPQYARFSTKEQRARAKDAIFRNLDDYYTVLRFPKHQEKTLRYCPECVEYDRKTYGEAYWHRQWFLRGVSICTKHSCRLKDTGIPLMSKMSPAFYAAEKVIPYYETDIEHVPDGVEKGLAVYVAGLFENPLSEEDTPSTGEFLTSKLEGTPYISPTGRVIYIKKMLSDMNLFYRNLDCNKVTEYQQLQKILLGRITGMYEVCQAAFFLGISVEDLSDPVLPELGLCERYDLKVSELSEKGYSLHRIADKLNCSPCTVSRSHKERCGRNHGHGGRKGKTAINWNELDDSSVGKVRDLCEIAFYGKLHNTRPVKISPGLINRLLGFPKERIKHLHKCMAVIREYEESWQQFRIRRIEWAWDILIQEKEPDHISWKNIYAMTGIRSEDFIECGELMDNKYILVLAAKLKNTKDQRD